MNVRFNHISYIGIMISTIFCYCQQGYSALTKTKNAGQDSKSGKSKQGCLVRDGNLDIRVKSWQSEMECLKKSQKQIKKCLSCLQKCTEKLFRFLGTYSNAASRGKHNHCICLTVVTQSNCPWSSD